MTTPLMVSVTELSDFMRCRWAWDVISPNRQSLQPAGVPQTALHLGTAVHYAIEKQAAGLDPIDELQKWYEKERLKIGAEYVARVGAAMGAEERTRLDQSKKMVEGMVRHYFDRYGDNPIAPLRYVANELAWRIPTGLRTGDDRLVYLVGTCDGIAIDEDDGLWIIEHKTYNQKPDMRWLQTDHQLTGYTWAMGALLNQPVQGVLYDGMMKKVPQHPKVLQNGNLSQEMNTNVSFHSYLKSIRKHHELADDAPIPVLYHGFLNRLRERDGQDQTPFFTRKAIGMSKHQLDHWMRDAWATLRDIANGPEIYKNFRWEGCYDCWVSDICRADQIGSDAQYIRETSYVRKDHREQYANMLEVAPGQVSSLEDLQALLAANSQ
jgi:hypothetical protein